MLSTNFVRNVTEEQRVRLFTVQPNKLRIPHEFISCIGMADPATNDDSYSVSTLKGC